MSRKLLGTFTTALWYSSSATENQTRQILSRGRYYNRSAVNFLTGIVECFGAHRKWGQIGVNRPHLGLNQAWKPSGSLQGQRAAETWTRPHPGYEYDIISGHCRTQAKKGSNKNWFILLLNSLMHDLFHKVLRRTWSCGRKVSNLEKEPINSPVLGPTSGGHGLARGSKGYWQHNVHLRQDSKCILLGFWARPETPILRQIAKGHRVLVIMPVTAWNPFLCVGKLKTLLRCNGDEPHVMTEAF